MKNLILSFFIKKNKKKKNIIDNKYHLLYYIWAQWYGCLAQLEEHLPYKQRVSGPSPLTPTIIFFE